MVMRCAAAGPRPTVSSPKPAVARAATGIRYFFRGGEAMGATTPGGPASAV